MENERIISDNSTENNVQSANIPQNNTANYVQNNAADYRKEKPKIPLADGVFAWITLALGFVFTHFAVKYAGGIWGGIFWLAYGISGAVFVNLKKITATKAQKILFAVAIVFCFVPIFCANQFINFLAAAFVFLLYCYILLTISGVEPFGRHFVINVIQSVFVRPFMSFSRQPVSMISVFSGKKRAKTVLFVLAGIVCAVPLTVVVAFLLMSSDDIFEGFMLKISENLPEISFSIVPEIIFAFPVAMFLFGALLSAGKPAPAERMGEPDYRGMPAVVGYVAVSPICVFYLIYMGIQISRIFSETLRSPANYAEFARRGFFELCVIAVINLAVIVIMQTFTKRLAGDKKPVALRVYTVLMCVCTLGIITTAFVKMVMYINQLGMTLLRVYTSWFMILLAVIFVVVIILQFKDFGVWKPLFAAFLVLFGVLCFSDVDGQIARYNISAYQSGMISEIDVGEFYELGFSAVEPAVRLKQSGYSSPDLDSYLKETEKLDALYGKFEYFSIPRAIGRAVSRG